MVDLITLYMYQCCEKKHTGAGVGIICLSSGVERGMYK